MNRHEALSSVDQQFGVTPTIKTEMPHNVKNYLKNRFGEPPGVQGVTGRVHGKWLINGHPRGKEVTMYTRKPKAPRK